MASGAILLVEDDLEARQQLDGVLTGAGYTVEASASAKPDAVALSNIVQPRVAVLPWRLGAELIVELAAELQESFGSNVILVAEHDESVPREHAERLHPTAVLTKPIRPLEVIAAVEAALAA